MFPAFVYKHASCFLFTRSLILSARLRSAEQQLPGGFVHSGHEDPPQLQLFLPAHDAGRLGPGHGQRLVRLMIPLFRIDV